MEIRPLTRADQDSAFDLLWEVWVAESVVHRALGTELSRYRDQLTADFEATVTEGLSLVAFG